MLRNTDHTNTVIDKVLDKYGIIDGSHDDFCLLQQLSDGEFLIPENANVFYAMNNTESELKFIARTKEEQQTRSLHRKRGRRKFRIS